MGWVIAATVSAQDPAGFEARAEYLLRQMDAGLLPTPMMIAMLQDPFPESRILALRVVASSSDPSQTVFERTQDLVSHRRLHSITCDRGGFGRSALVAVH